MEGWRQFAIEEAFHIDYGTRITRKKDAGTLYPVYGGGGETFRTDSYNREDCVVIARFGISEQCTRFVHGKFFLNDSGLTLRPREPDVFHEHYLPYLILGLNDVIFGLGRGTAQKNLNVPALRQLEVQFPESKTEQERIVAILDEAFAAIDVATANAEKNIANARELLESELHRTFSQRGEGWAEKSLEAIGTIRTGSTPKTSDQSNYGAFMPFIKPGDFNANGTLEYDRAGLSESGTKSARRVPAGSALMVCIGATIGKCGYNDQDVATNQQVNALTPSDGSSNRFIYYQMLTKTFQRKVVHASGQATLPIINKSKWGALTIWLPPTVEEQDKIVVRLQGLADEVSCFVGNYEQRLAHLDNLKQSLLHKAFAGELTAHFNATDPPLSESGA